MLAKPTSLDPGRNGERAPSPSATINIRRGDLRGDKRSGTLDLRQRRAAMPVPGKDGWVRKLDGCRRLRYISSESPPKIDVRHSTGRRCAERRPLIGESTDCLKHARVMQQLDVGVAGSDLVPMLMGDQVADRNPSSRGLGKLVDCRRGPGTCPLNSSASPAENPSSATHGLRMMVGHQHTR